MKNKKAELFAAEEVVKIVMAVICIIILITLAAGLYGIFTKKTDLEQARQSLKEIVAKINGLEEGQTTDYLVVAPKKWYFLNYNTEICICSEENLLKSMEDCCNKGAKQSLDKTIALDSMCNLYPEPQIKMQNSCVSFKNLPLALHFSQNNGKISIMTDYSFKANEIFNSLLEFKENEGKTIRELLQSFVENPKDQQIIDKIKTQIKSFAASRKIDINLEIKDYNGKAVLKFYLHDNQDITNNIYYKFNQDLQQREFELKNSEGESYKAVLNSGEWELMQLRKT